MSRSSAVCQERALAHVQLPFAFQFNCQVFKAASQLITAPRFLTHGETLLFRLHASKHAVISHANCFPLIGILFSSLSVYELVEGQCYPGKAVVRTWRKKPC